MARRTITTIAVLGLLFVAACDRTPATGSGIDAVVDTVDGVPRMTYPGNGGPTLAWTMDTVAVIGDIMGDDEHYMLGQVPPAGITGDAHGNVFVLDVVAHHVLSYDTAGVYLATYGRQGNGPGELGQPFGLGIGPGDTVWVEGITTHRLTGFPIAGGDARTITLPTEMFIRPPLAPVPGAFLTEGYPIPSFSGGDGASDDAANVVPLLSLRADDSGLDTLWSRPAPKQNLVQMQTDRGMVVLLAQPVFEPTLHWDRFSDGSVAIASDDSYTVHLLRPDGGEFLRLARDLPPRPVSDQDREAARDQIREASAQDGTNDDPSRRQMTEKRIEAMTFAPTVPRITGIRVDGADRIWVGVSLSMPDSTQRIDVFERDGSLLGTVEGMRLPATFFASDRAAALRSDPDTDVQQVVVMRLREGGS